MSSSLYSYIHIPFCEKKCSYCRFASLWKTQDIQIQSYCTALIEQIRSMNCLEKVWKNKSFLEKKTLKTIYFGWWTPGVLKMHQIESILDTLKQEVEWDANIEITLETTPNNVSFENVEWWQSIGINRVSMWIQTLIAKSLQEIGRWEKSEIFAALDILEHSGMNNISVDFIIWLPYVLPGEILQNIQTVLSRYSCVQHISVYMLEEYYHKWKLENDSKFENITYPTDWRKLWLQEEDFLQEYNEIVKMLQQRWFWRYEISNFSRVWYECQHNQSYWNHWECLAFWLSAHGFIDSKRFWYSDNFLKYYKNALLYLEELSQEDILIEKIMFWLRTFWVGKELHQYLDTEEVEELKKEWFLELEGEQLCVTSSWYLVMDTILEKIIR